MRPLVCGVYLAALLGEWGDVGQEMQGDAAPCGTTRRDAAAPRLLTHAGSLFWCILCFFFTCNSVRSVRRKMATIVSVAKETCTVA